MRILVTGGTGYVGSHAAATLHADGHAVRLLVRRPERVYAALSPFGVGPDAVDIRVGDVLDARSVATALEGCEAVLHAAAVYSFDARDALGIRETNVRATEVVLGAANRLGLDPIVHVSSYLALLPPNGSVLGPDEPLKQPSDPYCASKAAAERVARDLQTKGAPVTIVQPAGVWGPHDPNFGEQHRLTVSLLRGHVPLRPSGGLGVTDVRDLAKALAAAMTSGKGPRRYLVGGHFVSFAGLADLLARVTGRRLPGVVLPADLLLPALHGVDMLQRVLPIRLPVNRGGAWVIRHSVPLDSSRAEAELGYAARPLDDTVADTVRAVVASGHLAPRLAGRLNA